jgi:hypothetical protein
MTTETTPSEPTGIKPTKRYYCEYYEMLGQPHCDDRKNTIQCKYCIDKEKNYEHA